MSRTSSAEVQAILGGHWDGSTSLTAVIHTANVLVNWLQVQDVDSQLDADLLEEIECYLAAHLYEHADQIPASKSTGGASASFQGQTGMVLSSTKFGQTAMLLDVTGRLAQRSKDAETGGSRKASALWLGKPVSEQIDYEDRD